MSEQPRLIKNLHADYIPAKWDGTNRSGIRVVGKTVLVLMDSCSPISSGAGGAELLKDNNQAGGLGGVMLPPDVIERMDMAAETGVLVATSEGAFLLNEDMSPWSGEKPAPGDRVYIEKYAGKLIKGKDGATYRLMDYGSIGATYEKETGAISLPDSQFVGERKPEDMDPPLRETDAKIYERQIMAKRDDDIQTGKRSR